MPYCQNCGSEVEQLPEAAAVAETVSAEVQIAKIQADRDVQVARINASLARDELDTAEQIATTEAEAQVATAEAEAEIIGDALDANAMPEPDPEPAPVIITDDSPDEPEPDAPPLAEPGSGEPGPPSRKRVGLGMW